MGKESSDLNLEVCLTGLLDRAALTMSFMITTGKKWQDLAMFLILLWIELTVAAASDGKQSQQLLSYR